MSENVFLKNRKPITLADYLSFSAGNRENLGDELPVAVYRMLEYSLKEAVSDRFGKEVQAELFRDAGRRAGTFFAENVLDTGLALDPFISQLQKTLQEMKIGLLRIESVDEKGRIYLTISEDADCSGLPVLGETVCNYDEGFLAAVVSVYFGKPYTAVETDCWATGDRVCRFRVEAEEIHGGPRP